MTELVTFGESMLRLSVPEGERLERTTALAVHPGGAESNVAIAAAGLGLEAAWMSKLPRSPLGRRVANGIRQFGVEPLVTWAEGGRQGLYFAEPAGAPRGTDVLYDREHAAITTATPDELPLDRVDGASAFLTTGITPALSDTLAGTAETLLDRADVAVFDLNYRSKLWSPASAGRRYESILPAVDVLFAAARDVRATLGYTGDAAALGDALRADYDVGLVVVTEGPDGAVAVTDDDRYVQPAFDADTVDPIGTGDAFVGGFLARYLGQDSVQSALAYGAATAAVKRTIEGDVAIVSRPEIERILDDREADLNR